MEMEAKTQRIFRKISRLCVEALNKYFDDCENEIEDRDNLNDTIMKIGAFYGISLFDKIWFNSHNEEAKKNSPELIFVIPLPITSTQAAYDDSNEINITVWKNGVPVGEITIDEVEVSLWTKIEGGLDQLSNLDIYKALYDEEVVEALIS